VKYYIIAVGGKNTIEFEPAIYMGEL